jgi:hypothetical protein
MTSKVTIDAHAGWDIEVITEETFDIRGNLTLDRKVFKILAGTKADVYIWDNKEIVSIKELKNVCS